MQTCYIKYLNKKNVKFKCTAYFLADGKHLSLSPSLCEKKNVKHPKLATSAAGTVGRKHGEAASSAQLVLTTCRQTFATRRVGRAKQRK